MKCMRQTFVSCTQGVDALLGAREPLVLAQAAVRHQEAVVCRILAERLVVLGLVVLLCRGKSQGPNMDV